MPFVQRVVEPIYLSRRGFAREDEGDVLLTDYELDTVTNNTLSNALRQLASLVVIANDIFDDLSKELYHVCVRSNKLRSRIQVVEEKVAAFDPKKVTVPESDICSFSLRTVHFSSNHELTTGLFSADTRPKAVRCMYEAAAKTPVHVMRQLDRYRRDGHRSSRYFMCTPVLGQKRRRIKHRTDIEIETHTPAAVTELRRWTSSEALGDVTVAPDCSARVVPAAEDETDHRLPSPEEQVQAVANRFPSELVSVDVSGRTFERMSLLRRSLIIVDADGTVRRRHSSRRRPRGRRRNTIAGTDRKELRQAVIGESLDEHETTDTQAMTTLDDIVVVRSASSDLLRTKDESPPDSKKSHFNSLKQWGKVKLKLIKSVGGDSGSKSSVSPEETNIYEMVSAKGKKADLKHEKKACNIPISTTSGAMNMAVKLRRNEEGVQRRRQTRNGKDDALHSSSGNWSASSESGRTSIGSENTSTTTHQPKSTTTLSSAATSSNSLHHPAPSSSVCSRRKFLNTSTSSSVSEGTLTPDIIPDLAVPFADDGETSSIYSCDTEGYYTSFHLDSGLKTLKEEDGITSSPATPMHSTTALTSSPGRGNFTLTAENEYELFGKGSTSTTTSSAGTVCTTLMIGNNESSLSLALAPAVPERKSSLDRNSQMVVAMVHKQHGEVSDSPDSGHNTSSSPVDSACSPHGTLTGRSSEYEFSESDLEGVDRLERIRVKTTINSSRIPSMCVITPPPSDDETSLSHYVPSNVNRTRVPSPTTTDRNNFLETDFGTKNIHNLKLVIPQQNSEMSPARHRSPSRTLEKQISTESDRSSENETVKAVSPVRAIKTHMNGSFHNQAQNNEYPRDDGTLKAGVPAPTDTSMKAGQSKFALNPFNNVIDKVKGVLSHKKGQSPKVSDEQNNSPASEEKTAVDPGDYVTIADVRDKRKVQPGSPLYSNDVVKSSTRMVLPVRDTEYVSLNELPVSHSSSPTNVLVSPSDSLERKRRQGARVTLDSEGKVVYSSDSLRRNKGSHSTFEPGPYVKESTTSPTPSPLPSHRVPKSNIRPVTLLNQGRNGPSQATSYSKPSSPIPTSRKSNSPSRSKPTSPTSPLLGKVIIRAGGKSGPMSRVASPTSTMPIIASPSGRPMSPQSARGAYVNMQMPDENQRHRCVSPTERTTDEDEEGKPSSYAKQPPPPRYISPPPVQSSAQYNGSPGYWTLPNRRTQEDGRIAPAMHTTQQDGVGSGRYNTIASANSWNNRGYYPEETQSHSRAPTPGYGRNSPHGANLKSSQQNTPPPPSVSNTNQYLRPAREGPLFGQKHTTPMPASIPIVPRNTAYLNGGHAIGMQSSTPTKKEGSKVHTMDMSLNLSPIQKNAPHKYGVKPPQQVLYPQQNAVSSLNRPPQSRNNPAKGPDTARLLSKPKSSMTAEELFAAIHKSKKKLNIKTDTDSYSRSASPSCSSMTSLSPGSSESSINGSRNGKPETGTLGVENVSRNRHSWSPNSNELLDNRGYLDQHTSSPISQAGSRQSWACDRLGPIQQTSMNDFKRLLLQHGPKSSPSASIGSSSGRLSAAEQLRLSRQQKLTPVPPPPSVPVMNGSYLPRSPAEKRTNGSKLLHSPRSLATWRFASPRTDVLSSTILEDRAEEEKAANSPTQETSPAQPPKSQSSNQTSVSSSVRRPLNLSFNDTSKDSPVRKDPLKPTDVATILHQYRRESSPKARGELHQSGRITPTEQTTPVNGTNKLTLSNNRTMSQDLLSPSNVKENVNTNRQVSGPNNLTATQAANYKARQLFLQQSSALSSQQPSSPRIQVLALDKQQRSSFYNSHSSPGRSILGSLGTTSPSKSTLETAL